MLPDDDAVVLTGTCECDEFAVDFCGYDVGGACQGVTEAAAAPGYPFEDVAWVVLGGVLDNALEVLEFECMQSYTQLDRLCEGHDSSQHRVALAV